MAASRHAGDYKALADGAVGAIQHPVEALLARRAVTDKGEFKAIEDTFTNLIGDPIPWCAPNIDSSSAAVEIRELERLVPPTTRPACACLWASFCSLTGIGACYVCAKTYLIEQGEFGFALDSGRPVIMRPGWHFLLSPCLRFAERGPIATSPWRVGPLSIVRVPQGHFGVARRNTDLKILLPGTHAYVSGLFSFVQLVVIASPTIEYGTIKFITVPTGFVRICYYNGRALSLEPGRYAINSPMCTTGPEVDMRQENVKFSTHQVMLNGGVNLLCDGLLTYQIVDAVKLVAKMGVADLDRAIQDVTKAELAKVFASIHLEQVSIQSKGQPIFILTCACVDFVGSVVGAERRGSNGGGRGRCC